MNIDCPKGECEELNKIMMVKANRELGTKKNSSEVDIEQLCSEHKWKTINKNVYLDKQNLAVVSDAREKEYILKVGRIEPLCTKLMKVAHDLEDELSFRVPQIYEQGEGWMLMEKVNGRSLSDYYQDKEEEVVEISKRIADDYQKLIIIALDELTKRDILMTGEQQLFLKLNTWSKPLLENDVLDFEIIQQLKNDFSKFIEQKGERFFGLVHGNITGQHVFLTSEKKSYLLDLDVVSRAGRGYYDFLRAIDYMLLKTDDIAEMSKKVPVWFDKYLVEFDQEEVKLVFAFRAVGILGWDILQQEKRCNKQIANDNKKSELLNFIYRTY